MPARPHRRILGAACWLIIALVSAAGCSAGSATVGSETAAEDTGDTTGGSDPQDEPERDNDRNEDDRGEEGGSAAPQPDTPDPEPVPYVPAGRPGSAEAYDELIARLDGEIPAELRNEVPWPDLRNPDPVVAQRQIFDMWIWMAANYPEPVLVEVLTAPASPSRLEVVSIFGELDRAGELEERLGQPYRAFDHLVVTFESAGLPLWLARDVPEDAVVVYYSDNSGPTAVTDRETGDFLYERPGVPTRAWLSIMVPTDVGWQLWRDQLIEPNDSELETPDLPPPGADGERPQPEV